MDRGKQFPEELFHGTSAEMGVGDTISFQPDEEKRLNKDLRKSGRAFATTDRKKAEWYAQEHARKFGGTPTVYSVGAPKDMEYLPDIEEGTYASATGFRITKAEPVQSVERNDELDG